MPRLRLTPAAVFLLAANLLASCQLEKLYPDKVAIGVARLTVRNAANIVALIQADSQCGFASATSINTADVTGELGELGSTTMRVENCVLDFPEGTVFSTDCHGVETTISGRVEVSGTRTIVGRVTNNPATQVIPLTPDAVHFELAARFENFVVRQSTKKTAITIKSGAFSFNAEPHLAASASSGLCAVATRDITITDVTYEKSKVFLESEDRKFEAEVDESAFNAQVGRWGERENFLEGQLTVWGSRQKLPTENDKEGLDADYDAEEFATSYECRPDLKLPVSYSCAPILNVATQGASQLSVSLFGNVTSYVDEDKTCGFASDTVVKAAAVTGTLGRRGGQVVFSIPSSSPCRLSFSEPTLIYRDCTGLEVYATGTVLASGTKTVRGIVTGDPAAPIVPTSADPADVAMAYRFENFQISYSGNGPSVYVKSGALTGSLATRVGLDTSTGACSIKTPVAEFQNLRWENSSLVLTSQGHQFPLEIQTSNLQATNGEKNGRTNYLEGTITVNGTSLNVPTHGGAPVLNPKFDPVTFVDSYSCKPNLKIVESDAECSFYKTLGEGAARLLMQNLGTIASLVNSDSGCGFENLLVKLDPDSVVGDEGEIGSMSWSVAGCEVGSTDAKVLQTDCLGTKRYVKGHATASVYRKVVGVREKVLLSTFIDSIVPNAPNAVALTVTNATLDSFMAYAIPSGQTKAPAALLIHSGRLVGKVVPILGERASDLGVFDIKTPVAQLSTVRLRDADVTLFSGAKRFRFTISDARISTAYAGTWQGYSNSITGSVPVDGQVVSFSNIALDPAFDQSKFDQGYACTDDLAELIR
jgi:hypothetical protein